MESLTENILVFAIGFISCVFIFSLFSYFSIEKPLGIDILSYKNNVAPSDFIKESQIQVYEDKIVINLNGSSLSRYADTGSMKPILDENSNGIRIMPENENQINVGDIITFKQGSDLIVHRVIEKGFDSQGTYFITKGDNNSISDGKIRFSQIRYKTIGILW